MKREKIIYPKITKIKPSRSWIPCELCNKEFRKEYGYKVEELCAVQSTYSPKTFTYYCCNECVSNEEDIKNIIRKGKEEFIQRHSKI